MSRGVDFVGYESQLPGDFVSIEDAAPQQKRQRAVELSWVKRRREQSVPLTTTNRGRESRRPVCAVPRRRRKLSRKIMDFL